MANLYENYMNIYCAFFPVAKFRIFQNEILKKILYLKEKKDSGFFLNSKFV